MAQGGDYDDNDDRVEDKKYNNIKVVKVRRLFMVLCFF